jgi:hypothetical protein
LQANADDPQKQGALAALALELKEREAASGGVGASIVPNHLSDAQIVGQYGTSGPGVRAEVVEKGDKLYIDLSTPNTPEVRLVPLGGDLYRLEGYPDDFTAAFSVAKSNRIQLKVYLNFGPATVALKQETPVANLR